MARRVSPAHRHMSRGKIYGHIPGVNVGAKYTGRAKLSAAGVHAPLQAGIHGDSNPGGGAFSICISAGYEDDDDRGDTIIYVGSGGQDKYGEQIEDQSFENPRNKSLLISYETRRPVRVIRGKNDTSYYSPANGYRYDGLYFVDGAELRPGRSGRRMCFFTLRRLREEGDGDIPHRRLLDLNKKARRSGRGTGR